jgi:hypothetical protein
VLVQARDVELAFLPVPEATIALPSLWTWSISFVAFAFEKPNSF